MGRFLAGVASALLLAAAGIFFWTSRAGVLPHVGSPRSAQAGQSLAGAPLGEAPVASARTREEKRFGRLDKDRNGIITTAEYFAGRQKAFGKLDVDRDGRLSFDEWAIKSREKFTEADGDRSKALNAAEFATTAVVRKARPKCDCSPARRTDEED